MYYGTIRNYDVANGPGIRVSLFVSGCTNGCPNCFQPETWSFLFGSEFTEETENTLLGMLSPDHIRGLTVLGGEPFEPDNQRSLLPFLKKVKTAFPKKDIWCFSGNRLEELIGTVRDGELIEDGDPRKSRTDHVRCEVTEELLALIDVLVDGRYVERLKDLSLDFRGSSNQRLIDLPRTLANWRSLPDPQSFTQSDIVLWENKKSRRPL